MGIKNKVSGGCLIRAGKNNYSFQRSNKSNISFRILYLIPLFFICFSFNSFSSDLGLGYKDGNLILKMQWTENLASEAGFSLSLDFGENKNSLMYTLISPVIFTLINQEYVKVSLGLTVIDTVYISGPDIYYKNNYMFLVKVPEVELKLPFDMNFSFVFSAGLKMILDLDFRGNYSSSQLLLYGLNVEHFGLIYYF